MKHLRPLLSLALALILLLGPVGLTTDARAVDFVSFTIDGFRDYDHANRLIDLVNERRAAQGIAPLEVDLKLTDYAMTRAAEIYVYYDHTRPDGSAYNSDTPNSFSPQGLGEFVKINLPDAESVVAEWMSTTSHKLLSADYRSAGVGCFRQQNGNPAWVLLLHNSEAKTPFRSAGSAQINNLTINALSSNLAGKVLHHAFSNAYCACYLLAGTTIGAQLQLINANAPAVEIVPKTIDYTFTSTNTEVFSFNNTNRTITAHAPGVAKLGIRVDGEPIGVLNTSADVEVLDEPALSYEIDSNGDILIDYSEYPSTIDLYYKGTQDEMYTMGNREADGVYTHADPRNNETYTYIMRYWDPYLNDWVQVGDTLTVTIGNPSPVIPTPTPTPAPTPVPDGLWLPSISDLPNRTVEPTAEEVQAALDRIIREVYPQFTEWSRTAEYQWAGGTISLPGGGTTNTGRFDAAFAMAVSDLIFGTLPARADYTMTEYDLRPGDIYCDSYNNWYVVQDITPNYILIGRIGSTLYPDDVMWGRLYPTGYLGDINFVLTRYTSPAPGADVLHPSIVPAGAGIVASDNTSIFGNNLFTCVHKWTLTEDGTLYLEGYGRSDYGNDTWKPYMDRIKRVVMGPMVTGVRQDTFKDYEALEEVVFSDEVTEIRRSTFEGCTNLKSLQFGANLQTIGENAFKYSGLEHLALPDSVESIGAYAFTGCENLKTLYIPASVKEWGSNAFTGCSALEELTLAEGLTTLGYSAFNHLEGLKTVTIPGSLKTIPNLAFYFSQIETLHISEGVEVISEEAFAYCKQLQTIYLPSTLTTVENDAFRDCESVLDVYYNDTEARYAQVEIGSSNECLSGLWWYPTQIHFTDSECLHLTVSVQSAVAPTCVSEGLTEGSTCTACGTVITEQTTIPPTGRHSYRGGICTVCGAEEPVIMGNPFGDVGEFDFFYDAVLWAVENGVTSGTSPTTFAPYAPCTRGQVVTFLWRAMGEPEPTRTHNPFTDVSGDAFYYKAVLWAVEEGITAGMTPSQFAPDAICTRGQVATFLWRAKGEPLPNTVASPFADVKPFDFYYDAVLWAVEQGITTGVGGNAFAPYQNCTRGQIATFLYRAMN